MALRKILTAKDPALHKVCHKVTRFDEKLHRLLDDMKETVVDANGVGLAAPQIGIMRRVVVIDVGDGVRFDSHPELALSNSWSKEKLAQKLSEARELGLTVVPKLNFSAGQLLC